MAKSRKYQAQLSIALDTAQLRFLEDKAAENCTSVASIFRRALNEFIQNNQPTSAK